MNNSSPINDQADAIRWLLENRRPEVTPEKALRILRLVRARPAGGSRPGTGAETRRGQ